MDSLAVAVKQGLMIRVREAYDFGMSVPIYKDAFTGELVQIMEELDERRFPEDMMKRVRRLFSRDQDLDFEVEVLERGHVWLLQKDELDYMLRKAWGDLLFYDCSDFEQIKRPTLRDVAQWFDISYQRVREVAARDKWREERSKRDDEIRSEAMEVARADAVDDFATNVKIRLNRFREMESVYDEDLNAGKVTITTRDLVGISTAAHRMEKDLTGLGDAASEQHTFIQMLIKAGIAEVENPVEVIDVEAEDITTEA